VIRTAEDLYSRLLDADVEVILDDRDERPGVKFKDADLIGFPFRLTIGKKSLAEGKVELSTRRDRERQLLTAQDAVERIVSSVVSATR
jgi:prolyl-tRNA synthetase